MYSFGVRKRFASDARFKIQVLEPKTPHAVLELFLRNACDITYPYAWTVNFEMRLEAPEGISTGNPVDIPMIFRHSKTVPFSL